MHGIPLARGSVSLRVYPNDLPPAHLVEKMRGYAGERAQPARVREQIERVGGEALPRLRELLPGDPNA